MGHADLSLSSTARYLHASGSDKRRTIELLEGNWGERPKGDFSRT
jgi:hypothetical protein